MMRIFLRPALLFLGLGLSIAPAQTNVAPSVVIVSANMRPGTTLMDVIFRVNDPDDATVKVRSLAFKDGVRSFANIIRPVTFVEGTGSLIGDAIAANVNHALAWDVGADWNIYLGQAKFEILAIDGRGLLSFDWITIPAAGSYPQVTVSTNSPSNAEVLNALFWQYASGDPGLSLTNGVLSGNDQSGVFSAVPLASGTSLGEFAAPFALKRMNLAVAKLEEKGQVTAAREQVASGWLAANRSYSGFSMIACWGLNDKGQLNRPTGLLGVTETCAGCNHSLALLSDGTVKGWGDNTWGQRAAPSSLTNATAIAAGVEHSLALKSDGTVVAWGANNYGECTIPSGLANVIAIGAGYKHSLALRHDSTVVVWGTDDGGQTVVPTNLTGVTAIAAGGFHNLALVSNGTVVSWGWNSHNQNIPPPGLTGVVSVAAGLEHSLALKGDGAVVGWGDNTYGQRTPPTGLTGVIAIAAGAYHSLALQANGTVTAWGGRPGFGSVTPPTGLTGVTAIASGSTAYHSIAMKSDNSHTIWGYHSDPLNAPPPCEEATAIAASEYQPVVSRDESY